MSVSSRCMVIDSLAGESTERGRNAQVNSSANFSRVSAGVTFRTRGNHARMERSRLLLDLMPAVGWTTDRELRFTTSLGGGLRWLGLEDDQVVGLSLAEYLGEG